MSRRARWVVALAPSTGCAGYVLAGRGILDQRADLLAVLLVWLAAGLWAGAVLARGRRESPLAWLLAAALALQVVGLVAGPRLSDDLYRYVWDGAVQQSGTNPYDAPPASPTLARLRQPPVWPDAATCAIETLRNQPLLHGDPFPVGGKELCIRINRPRVRTIYPPVAQLAFVTASVVSPRESQLQVEVWAALTSLALTALVASLLTASGRRRESALVYAAGPLAVLEAGMDGHVDVLGALLALAAVAAWTRRGRRPLGPLDPTRLDAVLTGALLAAATLTKLYPAVVAVAFLGWRRAPWRTQGIMVGTAAAVVVVAYAPYVLTAGTHVLGYLPGYLRENEYASGGRYEILDALHVHAHAEGIAAALLLVVIAVSLAVPVAAGTRPLAARAATVVGLAFLIASPGNAWYTAALVALAIVAGRLEWLGVVAANYVLYFDTILGYPKVWSRSSYVLAAVVVALAAASRLLSGPRRPTHALAAG